MALPGPAVALVSWPGLAFASAISSLIDFASTAGCTTTMYGVATASVTGVKSRNGWYGSFGVVLGCIAKVDEIKISVWPSGAARAVSSVASMPAAPARLSTTNCWPHASVSLLLMMRATTSLVPPGVKPTSMRTGRVG